MNSYVHIPFCESKCKYCRFASIGNIDKLLINKYVHHLLIDIKNFKNKKKLETLYFGGGTPSVLEIKSLTSIINEFKNNYLFSENIEITLETTPQNITKQNLLDWEKVGIKRISFGIQTLNNNSLKTIGRTNKQTIVNSLDLLKNSNIKNISVDFIIGLPYVLKGELLEDIKYVLTEYSFIKHISVYMLEDYYDVDISDDKTKYDNIVYPKSWDLLGLKEDDFLDEYIEIYNFLENIGYKRYELSNFAKKGYESKHNKGYWEHKEIAGFGLGSHSFIGGNRYAYKTDFKSYYLGEKEYIETLNEQDIFIEKIMFGLRTNGIKKDLYSKLNQKSLKNFISDSFLELIGDYLVLTKKSFCLLDYIVLELIS